MTKRIVSFLLSAVMAAGLCVPAFATEAGGGLMLESYRRRHWRPEGHRGDHGGRPRARGP